MVERGKRRRLLRRIVTVATTVFCSAAAALGVKHYVEPHHPIWVPRVPPAPQIQQKTVRGQQDAIRAASRVEQAAARAAARGFHALMRDYAAPYGLLGGSHVFQQYAWAWEQAQASSAAYLLDQASPSAANRRGFFHIVNELPQYWNEHTQYWDPPNIPAAYNTSARDWNDNNPHLYYDDNGWIGLELMNAYDATHNRAYLDQAKRVVRFLSSGWDNSRRDRPRGGIFWGVSPDLHQRNTITNGLAINVALRIYEATHQNYYKDFALNVYNWLNHSLYRSDGLYNDNIGHSGHVDGGMMSYNEGVMLGANLHLYRITKNEVYLQRAETLAQKTIAFYGKTRMERQGAIYYGIFLQYVAELYKIQPQPEYLTAMRDFDAYVQRFTDRSGVFNGGGREILDRAAAIQVNATLALAEKTTIRLIKNRQWADPTAPRSTGAPGKPVTAPRGASLHTRG